MKNFIILLKTLMIEKNGYAEDKAGALIKKYPNIIAIGTKEGRPV